jgi:threonine dehydrogenase-like Zn-dependent dehydrogenase
MRGAVIHAPGDVRFETLDDPRILKPTDAVIHTAVTCVGGSDLWPWRGLDATDEAHPMGHEYVGFVEASAQATAFVPSPSPSCSPRAVCGPTINSMPSRARHSARADAGEQRARGDAASSGFGGGLGRLR